MAQLNYTIDSTNVFESKGFEPLPAGNYKVVIDSSDAYQKENGNVIIKLSFQVIEGQFANRKLFEYLVIEQQSEQAQQIARGKLNKLGIILGIKNLNDTCELHNKPLSIRVGIKNDDKGNPQNRIFDYMSLNGNVSDISDVKVEEKSTNTTKKPSFLK